jgi:cysteine sulfinate desulfinase/cysteine desulfurase-like protein
MAANNETGSIQPIRELARIAKTGGALFHTDAVQAVGKIPIDVEELGIDLLSLSSHKIHGPKGVGAVYLRKGIIVEALIHGGKQENGMRAGTENVPALAGLGKAAELAAARLPRMEEVKRLRNMLEQGLLEILPGSRVNGEGAMRLPNTLNMLLPGMRGESLVLELDRKGVSLSSGSACRSGSPKPSHVLLAMGLTDHEAHCSIRLSLGIENTEEEVVRAISLIREVVLTSQQSVRFVPCR